MPQLAIITGMSGSGKGSVIKAFEDSGFYCVDNMPVDLLEPFVDLMQQAGEVRRAALVIDIREGTRLVVLPKLLRGLRQRGAPLTLIYLEASNEVLLRRFSETRRPHPLAADGQLQPGINAERRVLAKIRATADVVVDTSKFNVHELRDFITDRVIRTDTPRAMRIAVTSFGYRNGIPTDADLVFDVRFLPNPNYVPAFRERTGRDPQVAKYIRSFPQTQEFIARISELLAYLIPHYSEEGKSYLTIAFGCTGGQHRSVCIAEAVSRQLAKAGHKARLIHRDMPRR